MPTQEQQRTIVLTGLTTDEVAAKLQISKLFEERGSRKENGGTCYLCKRKEGDESFSFDPENDACFTPPLHILYIEAEMGNISFVFRVCHECCILLNHLRKGMEEIKE